MNRSRSTTLLSITISAILFTGVFVPYLSQQAFAQVGTQDNLQNPPWGAAQNTPNALLRIIFDENFPPDSRTDCDDPGPTGNYVDPIFTSSGPTGFSLSASPAKDNINPTGTGATVQFKNLVDSLLTKHMLIEYTFCWIDETNDPPTNPGKFATIDDGICKDGTTGDTGMQFVSTFGPHIQTINPFNAGQTLNSFYLYDFWDCFPNPDWEQFDIDFNVNNWALIQVAMNSVSQDSPIGGVFEGVNTTALLVAGAQANALWLIPLITAIGVGIVLVKRKTFF